ncbi:restriction endonuclease [Enterococcus ureilyticus]|uniref:Restriction endonuclease n=1 Tax=Enterococcus ureilyticus TaxID=1131292 RepID=A0A1E5H8S8_9ENTE|nr:Sau3AI family type II restriction endonuclease [Enterococcus ureilyticus]MBM7687508.1 DNA mismatch repair protein MutH [Enterococcus ureilyticus]OEG21342.1 restriction endonuclease [Enterococcus ureilyticus]
MNDIYDTKEKVHERALEAVGKTLGEIDVNDSKNVNNKSYPGNVIEQVWYNHPADNLAEPDFAEAGVELKVTPIDKQTKSRNEKKVTRLIAGERLVLNKINYRNEYQKSFEESSFWHKNKLIELIQYYRRDTKDKKKISDKELIEDKKKFKIAFATLLSMVKLDDFALPKDTVIEISDKDFEIIRQDWKKISSMIDASKAEELSEGMTNYLGACTKSATGSEYTTQVGSDIKPKPRAYSFKTKFINELINNQIIGDNHEKSINSIVKDTHELKNKSLEDIIISRFTPFYPTTKKKWSQEDLMNTLSIQTNETSQKNLNNMIIRKILDLPASKDEVTSEEIEKADFKLKTVTLRNGLPKEHFKFQGIPSFVELVTENWEESNVADFLDKTKFLLLVFNDLNNKKAGQSTYETNPKKIFFVGAKFWNMPVSDIYGPCRLVWEEDVSKLKHGIELTYTKSSTGKVKVLNNFIKPSIENILHIRPDASVAQYNKPYYKIVEKNGKKKKMLMNNSRKLPHPAKWIHRPEYEKNTYSDDYMAKQAWWLSKDYIFEQIQDLVN